MANVKLGKKTYSGAKAVKMNTSDGGTTLFTQQEETPPAAAVTATSKTTNHNFIVSVAPVEATTATSTVEIAE